MTEPIPNFSHRLLSLDVMRGLIMIFLALESAGLYKHLINYSTGVPHELMLQFVHHPWHGLRFWDLIQPGFMFIAGASMAFSLSRQREQGQTWFQSFKKTLKRSGWLFFFGVLDYAVRPSGLSFELWDVLTQLSFTTLVAFLIFRWPAQFQLLFCVGLLVLTEVLYRYTNIPGFDQAFVNQHNFGNYMDWLLMEKINKGGWVAINCIPTAVHTILGALAGKVLLHKNKTDLTKVKVLIGAAVVCFIAGYFLDLADITPIIKRIATSSFVLVSAGWCLLSLSLFYWVIDCKSWRGSLQLFIVVGSNSLAFYLFLEIVAKNWFNGYISAISNGLMTLVHIPLVPQMIITSLFIFFLEWRLCYFLYKRKIFFKL